MTEVERGILSKNEKRNRPKKTKKKYSKRKKTFRRVKKYKIPNSRQYKDTFRTILYSSSG